MFDQRSIKKDLCRQESLPSWRASANLTLSGQKPAVPTPPPESYQPANLIKSIESRLGDSITGDSQQIIPQAEDTNQALGNLAASAGLYRAEESFVTVSQASDEEGSQSSLPDSKSAAGSITLPGPAGQGRPIPRIASPAGLIGVQQSGFSEAGSPTTQDQDIVAVLSFDNERQHQLADTAALWQVAHILHLSFPIKICDQIYM